jgi:hypothetical protein
MSRSPILSPVSIPDLSRMIVSVRGAKVIIDADLASLYGVTTGNFNKAVTRNLDRFPETFRFQLKRQEFTNLRFQFGTSNPRGGRRYLPYAFTEHGALMAATILNSPQAVKMSIALIEAFVRLRQEFATTQSLARRLAEIERTVVGHDTALKELFRAIKPLLAPPPEPPRKKIGFRPD